MVQHSQAGSLLASPKRLMKTAAAVVTASLLFGFLIVAWASGVYVGDNIGSARAVKLEGAPVEETSGEFLVLRVGNRSIFDWVTGNAGPGREEASSWRTASNDVRFESNDAVRAGDDAWVAATDLSETTLDARGFIILPSADRFVPYLIVDATAKSEPGWAAGLRANDRIASINGVPATMASYSAKLLLGEDGFPVTVTVTDGNTTQDRLVSPVLDAGQSSPDREVFYTGMEVSEHRAVLVDHPRPLVPEGEEGPSSGLIHGLALLDAITSGDLTGGHHVAATGTLSFLGTVGVIGGMTAKTQAAINAGAELLIVPEGNFEEAVKAAKGRIPVLPVATLEQAVAVLCMAGGSSSACAQPVVAKELHRLAYNPGFAAIVGLSWSSQ